MESPRGSVTIYPEGRGCETAKDGTEFLEAAVPADGRDAQEERAPPPDARWLEAVVPCYRPLRGFRTRSGTVSFKAKDAEWVNGNLDRMTVACGQCRGCRLARSLDWAVRIMHERSCHERASFLTLTYAELPPGEELSKRDLQLFWKRLRERYDGPFRYFACGEYGEKTGRPHYHAALFGEDFREGAESWKAGRYPTWTNARLDSVWGHGRVVVGALTVESAQYVARYVLKKRSDGRREDGRASEFATMSRRPGIGSMWFEKFGRHVFPRDEVFVGRHTRRPPGYYLRECEKVDPELAERVKAKRAELAGVYEPDAEVELLRREAAVTVRDDQAERQRRTL